MRIVIRRADGGVSIIHVAIILVIAAFAGLAGSLTTLVWFKTAIALKNVVGCVGDVETWLTKIGYRPQVFVNGQSGGLILTELLIKDLYKEEEGHPHPPIYVLYQLPKDSSDEKYNNYGTKFVASSTHIQFFIPDAIKAENRNTKILVFNDWAEKGDTLADTKHELEKLKFTQVKTAVASADTNIVHPPDHTCIRGEEAWRKLPWKSRFSGF